MEKNQCCLCDTVSVTSRYCSAGKWSATALSWVIEVSGITVTSSSTVCRACDKYIQRHVGESSCKRWTKDHIIKANQKCLVNNCMAQSLCDIKICDYDTAKMVLGNLDPCITGISLCTMHYNVLYRALNEPEACASCKDCYMWHRSILHVDKE